MELHDFPGTQDELEHFGHQDVHDAEVGAQQRPKRNSVHQRQALPEGTQDELEHIAHQHIHDAEVGVQQRPNIRPIEILERLPYFQVEDLNLRVDKPTEKTQVQTEPNWVEAPPHE